MAASSFPAVPAKHADFLSHLNSHPNTPIQQLLQPYNEYDAVARKVFAQEPSHPALQDNHLNVVPVYDEAGSTSAQIRARDLASESPEEKQRYILPLSDENRRPNGSPAVVPTIKEFQNNFSIFSEGSLSDLDWSNVVVAGSAVVTSLMPIPEKHRASKRALRQFYHEQFAPASDVDLFIYGLSEDEAVEKIKQIADRISNAILYETTTVRTKNTITIVSQYPTRHVQIVLRIYKSVAEILTGFDVDCSCAVYDGKQVYVSPRALVSYITQTNQVDLTRRSPSYENRLSKYSHRGFEVYWPQLERSRIDPTIFERSFARTVGLARLLVLEKLPKTSDRETYLIKRRAERGRPNPNTYSRSNKLHGNIKDIWEDETPDWQEEDEISDYNTFSIPYGERFHARRIIKLLYTKDLLLNAEWNKPKDRKVHLHRHPAFFGYVADVMHDCCGDCPKPVTDEEKEVAEEESKTYISGDVSFIKDDPGRQAIGSFNPITDTDWTEMAYVGNTERLCHDIVEHDLEGVKNWLAQDGADPNTRDYTGRTPLHLACMTSTPEIVQALVDHGARLIARVVDGRTALHMAAARGSVEIVRILLTKSGQNEEEENDKQDAKSASKKQKRIEEKKEKSELDEDGDFVNMDDSTSATSSYVDVRHEDVESDVAMLDGENELEPDIYDINIPSWDFKTTPLHLAILNGHIDVIEELVSSFGADVLMPVKLMNDNKTAQYAILTLALALRLPLEKAKPITEKLLQLGASPAQADVQRHTALHYLAATSSTELLDLYLHYNEPAVKRVINHLAFEGNRYNHSVYSAFGTAINARSPTEALRLLELGSDPSIKFEQFLKSAKLANSWVNHSTTERNLEYFRETISQPIILAVQKELPLVALELLAHGVDPNTLTGAAHGIITNERKRRYTKGESLLDCVQEKIKSLRKYRGEKAEGMRQLHALSVPLIKEDDQFYLNVFQEGTYQMWAARNQLQAAKKENEDAERRYNEAVKGLAPKGWDEKMAAVKSLLSEYQKLEAALIEKGAKQFYQLHPDFEKPSNYDPYRPMDYKPGPFEVKLTFTVPDLTDVRKDGYLRLYEAAWNGDLDTIKSLTLGLWAFGPKKDNSPLQINVQDSCGSSPFSIALLRGHQGVARGIIDIAKSQYKPKEAREKRYKMEEGSDDESEDDVNVIGEDVDDEFTVDNIGEVDTEVVTDAAPILLLSSRFPVTRLADPLGQKKTPKRFSDDQREPYDLIEYMIATENIEMLVFLLDLCQELTKADSEDESNVYQADERYYELAIRLGHLQCLEQLIKRGGAGFPLDQLVQKSGIEVKPKTRYYRGLTFHGQKHKDWASAGREFQSRFQSTHAPLLRAAFNGKLNSTEWFLGTAPARYYLEFAKAHEQDDKLSALAKSTGGLEGTIGKWLGMRNELVLHCAVMARPDDESCRLIEYLVKQVPECLEAKSLEGHTPLTLAFSLHRKSYAEILIKAGANQAARDRKGNNVIHLLLWKEGGEARTKPDGLKELLELLDPRLVPSLLTERSSDEPGSATPLARWMHEVQDRTWSPRCNSFNLDMNNETDEKVAAMRAFLEFADSTGQEHLGVLDGSGNTPLHNAIKHLLPRQLEMMIQRRPDLVYRENATGSTPFEIAVDNWLYEATVAPPHIPRHDPDWQERDMDECKATVDKSAEYFTVEHSRRQRSQRQIMYDMCREAMKDDSKKRKLVSLHEANEVAKRLAARQRRYTEMAMDTEEEPEDEVKMWYCSART
ncbi:hypothetical protein MW887_005561 [Aspergillus wentii]|nr:hypothetical protein MW887_005561 [Aspergillus wentii]